MVIKLISLIVLWVGIWPKLARRYKKYGCKQWYAMLCVDGILGLTQIVTFGRWDNDYTCELPFFFFFFFLFLKKKIKRRKKSWPQQFENLRFRALASDFYKKFHFTISKAILLFIPYHFTTHPTSQLLFSYTIH